MLKRAGCSIVSMDADFIVREAVASSERGLCWPAGYAVSILLEGSHDRFERGPSPRGALSHRDFSIVFG